MAGADKSKMVDFMNCIKNLLFFAALSLMACFSHAGDGEGKISVRVIHSGEDRVGEMFSHSVREAVRSSSGFRLKSDVSSAITVHIITMDPDSDLDLKGSLTVAAISYTMRNNFPFDQGNPQTWYSIHMSSELLIAGRNMVSEQARSVVSRIDKLVEDYLNASNGYN